LSFDELLLDLLDLLDPEDLLDPDELPELLPLEGWLRNVPPPELPDDLLLGARWIVRVFDDPPVWLGELFLFTFGVVVVLPDDLVVLERVSPDCLR
jgi:hypothetical protein